MKTITIIDLLNKIANGEQPKHIRIYNEDWYWNDYDGYVTKWSLSTTPDAQHYLFGQYRLDFVLDKEVEIIEEDKKIEKLNLKLDDWTTPTQCDIKLSKKIDEIIDYINNKEE